MESRTILVSKAKGGTMNISSSSMASQSPNISILKAANQQPELAGDLISKTIAGLLSAQSAQTTPQSVLPTLAQSGIGSLINTVA